MTVSEMTVEGAIPQKWLITGGCGFIGARLVASLIKRPPSVRIRVLDNLTTGTRTDLNAVCDFKETARPAADPWTEGVVLVPADIRDAPAVAAAAAGAEVIVHLAANTGVAPSVADPRADMEANVVGTFNLLEAARQHAVRRFVFASSGAPVGECEPPIHEELAPHPVSPYGASKLAGEGYCSAYFRTFGVETVMLRFGNVYGPGSLHKGSVVARFIKRAMEGKTLKIYGDGRQTRDFIYIDDLVRAIWQAATVPGIGGEAFQIATNAETTVSELAVRLVARLAAAGMADVKLRHAAPRLGDVQRNYSDTAKARDRLEWRSRVDLDAGLDRTLAWFLETARPTPDETVGGPPVTTP